MLLRLIAFAAAIAEWSAVSFEQLAQGAAMRLVVVSGTTLVLRVQILLGLFFLYALEYPDAHLVKETN
jgi:hypothetical protein